MKHPVCRPVVAALVAIAIGAVSPLAAQAPATFADVASLAIGSGSSALDPALAGASGLVDVVVKLSDAPLAVANGKNSRRVGSTLSPAQQRGHSQNLTNKQSALMAQIAALGGVELARVRIAYNAVIVRVDASRLAAVAALPGVVAVKAVVDYELDLSDTVPYIGATAVQNAGFDGTGVTVAVLDSGIDYTHRNLGGGGTAETYTAAYGTTTADARNKTLDGLFPTAKVVGGYDFVGEVWPGGPLQPDADPIDCGPAAIPAPCAGSHGTHVADIIAGRSLDNSHKGVAPGAKLMAVKVCSAVASSCSGVAILQAFDFSLDPNGDGSMADAVDVVNLSLGASYGQKENSTVEAAANVSNAGVVVVASAGNSADRPYITGSPSMTPEVIGVAQTTVPSDKVYLITAVSLSPPAIGVWQTWSAAPTTVNGPLDYDTTNPGTRLGCSNAGGANPWVGTPLAGKIVLMDRGVCAVSLKVANAGAAGAIAAIVANNVAQGPGELPPSFSYGGGVITIAGYTVTLADGNRLKAVDSLAAGIDASNPSSIVGSMVSSSSRGPSYGLQQIKPDIGAPGASLSANAGSGTGQTAFGGTSGAAPMVAGAAALLVQAYPTRTVEEIKSLLMNTAETNIYINSIGQDPTLLAPITRIGGGEVRVKRALDSKTAAWDVEANTGSLSFGYHSLDGKVTLSRQVRVQNYDSNTRNYTVTPSFRYADDAASGAVTIDAPTSLSVPGKNSRVFTVKLHVDATKLPVWTLNGGSRGGDGFRLQGVEFDGYITIADATDSVHVAWQVLPHRSAGVKPVEESVALNGGVGSLTLQNKSGVLDGRTDVFSLLGTSPKISNPNLPNIGDGFAIVDLASVGARLVNIGTHPTLWTGNLGLQFAVNTYGQRSHPNYPAQFQVFVDRNNDGTDDFVFFNTEVGGFAATGQNVVAVGPLPGGPFTSLFFNDADLNSANGILTVPLSRIGITNPNLPVRISVIAVDNYFTGFVTDVIENMIYAPGLPRFAPSSFAPVVPAGGNTTLSIGAVPGGEVSTSQSGMLLMYRDAKDKLEADAIPVTP